MQRTNRTLAALAPLLTLGGCRKEGSPPVKGPQPVQLPVHPVPSGFTPADSPTWEPVTPLPGRE
ncbi:hypothetical protein ACIGEZ_17420 [Streptomyces sp. NPDC085481]|uniref:hypothetical protein n=1 Tax=Streptomyces sp. NPDC085481 TaxID=3365727 RepID=UPI0037D03E4B